MKQALTGKLDGKLVLPGMAFDVCIWFVFTVHSPILNLNGPPTLN